MLDTASVQDIKRLLELFPIKNLREVWADIKGTKEELCFEVAEQAQKGQVIQFADTHLSCCKQHVYIFDRLQGLGDLPETLGGGERVVHVAGDHTLYIVRSQYTVVLRAPLEETTLEFLWPVRIDLKPNHVLVRFVVLEKNLASYFERSYYLGGRNVEEKSILEELTAPLNLTPTDLHRGVKRLWAHGFMDSPRAEYKKPISTAREAMDEQRGIKEYNPELYEVLQDSTLFGTMFTVAEDQKLSVTAFHVDPSRGYIAFPRYSETVGDTDVVIEQILQAD